MYYKEVNSKEDLLEYFEKESNTFWLLETEIVFNIDFDFNNSSIHAAILAFSDKKLSNLNEVSAIFIDGDKIEAKRIDCDKIEVNRIKATEKLGAKYIFATSVYAQEIECDKIECEKLSCKRIDSYEEIKVGF